MWQKILKFVISLFWPEIKKLLAKYAKELLAWLEKRFQEVFSKKADKNTQEAETEAANADYKAEQASSPSEAEKWKAVADVWREIAEKFRQEKEQLEAEISSIRVDGENKVDESIDSLDFNEAFDVSDEDVKLSGNQLLIERK